MSMIDPNLLRTRRELLAAGVSLGVATLLAPAAQAALAPTPRQTEGPFYPPKLPADSDNDLARLTGQPGQAQGEIIHVTGRVRTPDGKPVAGARVEIWQADANGIYMHPRDRRTGQVRDGNFQGFGATEADREGHYAFRTIRPAPYGSRTPHIHFKVLGRNVPSLTTQMYFADEPRNDFDGILNNIADPATRARLIVPFAPAPKAESGAQSGWFEIVLGGPTSSAP